jgi:hypothetical protein
MKTKFTFTFILSILLFNYQSFAQLKVDNTGRIGMGTQWPNPGYKCHIAGNLLVTNYPESPSYELQLKSSTSGTDIGSSGDKVNFWSSWNDFNKLYAEQFYKISDSTLKRNIIPIKNGLAKVLQLKVYSYDLMDNRQMADGSRSSSTKKEYGFLSQEVEKSLPEIKITDDSHGYKLMDYDQIIPLLVSGIKEQHETIDALQNEIEKLKEVVKSISANDHTSHLPEKTVLFQNNPNPFNEQTKITFEIAEDNTKDAAILLFNMNGTLLKTYAISNSGKGELTINANELQAGMYIYSLITNGKEIDSKKMILLNN